MWVIGGSVATIIYGDPKKGPVKQQSGSPVTTTGSASPTASPSVKFCGTCGDENQINAEFCMNCGNSFAENKIESPKK